MQVNSVHEEQKRNVLAEMRLSGNDVAFNCILLYILSAFMGCKQ